MPDTGSSNPFVAIARKRGAYTSEDMTDDAIAVLDALDWKRAHLFGASLGGIIAQRIALRHPERVLSVASAAGWHGPKLRELRKPTLVLHGDHDPLPRVSAARNTAKAIAGARGD